MDLERVPRRLQGIKPTQISEEPVAGIYYDQSRCYRDERCNVDRVFNAIIAVTALVAIVLTYVTIKMQRQGNRDQTFLRIHEIVMRDEMRVGRASLIEAGESNSLPAFGTEKYGQMTHALGGLETAGIYIAQGSYHATSSSVSGTISFARCESAPA
jgi:hypothetical protein